MICRNIRDLQKYLQNIKSFLFVINSFISNRETWSRPVTLGNVRFRRNHKSEDSPPTKEYYIKKGRCAQSFTISLIGACSAGEPT